MESRYPRARSAAALSACVAVTLVLAGCTWLYGPAVELPEDIAEAVEKPRLGSRALLRANQCDLELASWGPALQSAIDSLGENVDPAQQTRAPRRDPPQLRHAALVRSHGDERRVELGSRRGT